MKEKNILISIIIPHFNSVRLVRNAIEHAACNEKVEVVVVDDKSTVSREDIISLERHCKEKNVYFLRNETEKKGAGVCRNIGLQHAHGDWLLFVDADDYLTDGWYEAVQPFLNSKADIVYFPPTSLNLSTGKASTRHILYRDLVLQYIRRPNQSNTTQLKYGFCTPWSKLFRRDLITRNRIAFDETPVSNDIMFTTKCAYHAGEILADNHVIYCVTRSSATLTSAKNEEHFWVRIGVLMDRYHYLQQHLPPRDFRDTHLGQYLLGQFASAAAERYGIKTCLRLLRTYQDNDVHLIRAGLFGAKPFWQKTKMLLLWFEDIYKSRRHEKKR